MEDRRLLLIRRARSSRQAVKAKQPWQLIASSSCQVPLGNRLKLQSDYFFCFLMLVSGCWTYLSTRQHFREMSHVSEIKVSCESKFVFCFFFPFPGTGWKTRPQRTERPDGRRSRCSPARHASSASMIHSVQISLPLSDFSGRNFQLYKLTVQRQQIHLLFMFSFCWVSVQ